MTCLNCKKTPSGRIWKNRKYCSLVCQQTHQKEVYIANWISRKVEGGNSYGYCSKIIRGYLFAKQDSKCSMCSMCGWGVLNIFTRKVPLEVDHINGNSNDNSPENLRLICPNCHSLTSTYKGANRNSGRTWRAKYALGNLRGKTLFCKEENVVSSTTQGSIK